MDRQRLTLLVLLIALALAVGGWRIYEAWRMSQTYFMTGKPPQDLLTTLLPKEADPSAVRAPAVLPEDPVRFGGVTSVVSVIQFGDYECEPCRQFSRIAAEVVPTYGGQVRYVWRDFPLVELHGRAMAAAVFARCAGRQGRFWEAHDRLVSGGLGESDLRSIANDLRLDTAALSTCRSDGSVKAAVEQDVAYAKSEGIAAVPFIFVGTKGSIGLMSEQELRTAIEEAGDR